MTKARWIEELLHDAQEAMDESNRLAEEAASIEKNVMRRTLDDDARTSQLRSQSDWFYAHCIHLRTYADELSAPRKTRKKAAKNG